MMKKILILIGLLISTTVVAGGRGDDPLLTKFMIDRLEYRAADGPDPVVLKGQAWVGKDLDKLWVKVDAERVSGKTKELELQFLYSKAIAPYWDVQVGWRHDNLPNPNRDWLAFGFQGLAPYFFEIDVAGFIGEGGQTAFRLEAEYEILFTQKLILTPEVEVNFYGKDDVVTGVGAGLSDIELGLRLRYEIKREFAPYIGINWTSKYGKTADIAKIAGEDKSDAQFVVGVRAWF
ncbi:MAG: copper resistance protein CopB [Piscirickettsiaceae bacterium]|nr:MAG: copper resistance protein CopB [Piscirickettsiaceae bacterium]